MKNLNIFDSVNQYVNAQSKASLVSLLYCFSCFKYKENPACIQKTNNILVEEYPDSPHLKYKHTGRLSSAIMAPAGSTCPEVPAPEVG